MEKQFKIWNLLESKRESDKKSIKILITRVKDLILCSYKFAFLKSAKSLRNLFWISNLNEFPSQQSPCHFIHAEESLSVISKPQVDQLKGKMG